MNLIRDDLDGVLVTEQQIHQRLDELAADLQRDYVGGDLTIVAALTGSVMFVADLLRRLPMQLRLDWIGISSYRGETRGQGELLVTKALQLDVRDRDVLLVDDILDTGQTLVKLLDLLRSLQPRSIRSCVFLEKEIPHQENIRADYVGFNIPDTFVVGYGLDFRERYRNLPYVATLQPHITERAG